tara:strand:+ start:95 stop:250 length:156 start_codon:yes stop_codon:yes gene_type:complete
LKDKYKNNNAIVLINKSGKNGPVKITRGRKQKRYPEKEIKYKSTFEKSDCL